jgi:flagellar protein FliS
MSPDARFVYRLEAAQDSGPVQIVVLLYEQLIADLRGALSALEQQNTEQRTSDISHALEIVAHLQGRLDMERGGDVARNLDRFYDLLRKGIIDAQFRQSAEILQMQIKNLVFLREAWVEVARAVSNGDTATPAPSVSESPAPDKPAADWSA